MSYVNLDEYANRLIDANCTREYTDVRVALMNYPKLKGFVFDGRTLLLTKEVNDFVDLFESGTSEDGKVYVRTYLMDSGVQLHSSPAVFYVAQHNVNGFGLVPYPNWQSVMERWKINPDLIESIDKWLQNRPPVNYGV